MGCGLGAGVILTQLGMKRILTGRLHLKSEMWRWVLLTGRGKVPKNGNYHTDQCKWGPQPECLLKFKHYIQKIYRTVWRICILILGFEGLRLSYHAGFQSREAAFPRNFETSLNAVNFDSYQWKEKSHWENSLTNPTKKDNKNLFFFLFSII